MGWNGLGRTRLDRTGHGDRKINGSIKLFKAYSHAKLEMLHAANCFSLAHFTILGL